MSGDKTEKPTAKKLRDARQKGQVCQSKDLPSAVVFVAGFMMIAMILPGFADRMRQFMHYCFSEAIVSHAPAGVRAFEVLSQAGSHIMAISAPVLGAMFMVALFISYIQVGSIFTFETLKPKFNKLNPVEGFKNIFLKATTYIELAKSLLKLVLVTTIVYIVIKANFRYIVLTARQPLWETSLLVGMLLYKIFIQSAILFLVIAAADFFIQKKQFEKQMRMSKDEVKQEHKQSEGDPHTKHMRKHMHQEISRHNMVQDVKKASVVVVNPEHIAVALRYDKETMNAPQVMAKGHNLWAAQIIEIAKHYGVPIMRNVPLAHALDELEIGDEVPEGLYEAVAELLNWVYKLAKK